MTVSSGDSAFVHLGEQVREALAERGFATPTEPQQLAIPHIAGGEHTLVIAPTGTGKTETAMLPVLDSLAQSGEAFGIQAIYVTPLRALNRDMRERLEWWGEYLDLEIDVRHGDTTDYRRRQQATDPPDVLVTTPETLQAMFTGKRLREALEDVDHLVVDEVHELAASKRGAQLTVALERLRAIAGEFQRIGLSATVGDPEAVGAFLTGDRGCAICEVDAGSRIDLRVIHPDVTDEDIDIAGQLMTDERVASHVRVIRDVVAANDSSLIFVNTRQTAEALGSRLSQLDTVDVGVHHGSLSKDARIDVEDEFKAGDLDGLLCTSSMELGIDVGHVDHVIQYSSPRQAKRLLQRVGRAGHYRDTVSRGTIVATSEDDAMEAMTIARRAGAGLVEPAKIHEGSLDVVANQVAALAECHDGLSLEDAQAVITSAYPFQELEGGDFEAVVEHLAENRIVRYQATDGSIEPAGTWQYVYANLSMIPDEENYAVEDVASGSQVGTLDERFVVTFAEPGESFVHGGEMWRVIEVDEDEKTVTVTPIEDPGGEVPSWVGQEIPVPESVALEVGELRNVVGDQLAAGGDTEHVATDVATRYPADAGTVETAIEPLKRQVETAPMPTDDRIVIEQEGRTVIVNCAGGHEVNETLGRIVSSLLGQRTGSAVGLEVDPYRIELEVPPRVGAPDVEEILETTDPDHVEALIELTLDRSDTLSFRLSQVAEQFGVVKSWRGDGSISGKRLRSMLEDTPTYDEAKRAVIHDDLDIEGAQAVLEAIQAGDRELVVVGEHTPVGVAGQMGTKDLLSPENADASVINTVRDRLADDEVILLCVHCAEYEYTKPIRRVREEPSCPECGSTMIAALNPWDEETVTAVRTDDKDEEQQKRTRRAYQAASLVQAHGRKAVIALAGRGVGPDTAARIINKHREDEVDFYRDILEAERQYARTKAFW